jgi:hypothetical protein
MQREYYNIKKRSVFQKLENQTISKRKSKAVPLHALEALGGRGVEG